MNESTLLKFEKIQKNSFLEFFKSFLSKNYSTLNKKLNEVIKNI